MPCSWGEKFPLEKHADGTFSIALDLAAGLYQFKFLVDGKAWKYDPDYAFAPDGYGNLNNFISITATAGEVVQVPIPTMLRGPDVHELPTMNPAATLASSDVRKRATPPTVRQLSPTTLRTKLPSSKLAVAVPTANDVTVLQSPRVKPRSELKKLPPALIKRDSMIKADNDAEYGLNVTDEAGRTRTPSAGSITRSKSEESLKALDVSLESRPFNAPPAPKKLSAAHREFMFNVSEYRRTMVKTEVTHHFWDPENTSDSQKRAEVRDIRREEIREAAAARPFKYELLFIESICDDPELIAISINEMKLNSQDYAHYTLDQVVDDYHQRIEHYRDIYAPLEETERCSFIKLDKFIQAHYPDDTRLSVWTSTMTRTGQTVERIAAHGRVVVKWKQLDEIDAGICDGMTYEQVATQSPDEYRARQTNKLHYRYPRGESYQDVIHRLEPVITELMRLDRPVLIVAHQAILRVLYAYLTNKHPEECPTIEIPLHVVIQITPKAYHCEEVWHHPI
ncbi:hypothetical protein B5M09_008860 [Aphanomyces astaci]|uniref:AMP-activated protein kinase glycogen-binding domain-containing protein n=1 Tax=Aphanomyces astaci TaxID=112090 RepID=A0A425DAR7_APHAT|nr:hypothetical protein B5M09_008860 [Aphanomyces astaci]